MQTHQITRSIINLVLLTSTSFIFLSQALGYKQNKEINSHVNNQIQGRILKLKHEMKIPNLAISFFTPTDVLGSFTLGDFQTNGKTSDQTLYNVGSIAKIFTAPAVFQMVEKGLINLETPITHYTDTRFNKVMQQQCPQKLDQLNKINIGHLLSHSSGITMDPPGANIFFDPNGMSDGILMSAEQFENNFCRVEFIYEPGKVFKYSNLGFVLIKQILESKSSSGVFTEHMKSNVFSPLSIHGSIYNLNQNDLKNLVYSYGRVGSAYPVYSDDKTKRTKMPQVPIAGELDGAIGANISIQSLTKLGQEMIRWTNSENDSILFQNKDLWRKILLPVTDVSKNEAYSYGYRMISFNFKDAQKNDMKISCFGHTGSSWGFKAILYVCPEINMGFAAQFNAWETNREAFMTEVINILLANNVISKSVISEDVETWIELTNKFRANSSTSVLKKAVLADNSTAPTKLVEYLGDYYSGGVGVEKITISQNGKLVFMGHELTYENGDTFRWPLGAPFNQNGEPVEFQRDKDGSINGLRANWALQFYRL